MGLAVVLRAMLLGLLPLVCAACANDSAPKVMGYQAGHPSSAYPSSGHPLAISRAQAAPAVSLPSDTLPTPHRKSMADKVLAAMALERVTGRKPDPSRLTDAE